VVAIAGLPVAAFIAGPFVERVPLWFYMFVVSVAALPAIYGIRLLAYASPPAEKRVVRKDLSIVLVAELVVAIASGALVGLWARFDFDTPVLMGVVFGVIGGIAIPFVTGKLKLKAQILKILQDFQGVSKKNYERVANLAKAKG